MPPSYPPHPAPCLNSPVVSDGCFQKWKYSIHPAVTSKSKLSHYKVKAQKSVVRIQRKKNRELHIFDVACAKFKFFVLTLATRPEKSIFCCKNWQNTKNSWLSGICYIKLGWPVLANNRVSTLKIYCSVYQRFSINMQDNNNGENMGF